MEKLTVEIELAHEEMAEFNKRTELGCLDREKYLKRAVEKAVRAVIATGERIEKRKKAGQRRVAG